MATITKNSQMKAFSKHMSKNNRKVWEMVFNTNPERGKVFDQWELNAMFDRYGENTDGASKAVHLFETVAIKRMQYNAYIPHDEHSCGNQGIDEINCFIKYKDTEYSDLLCPIFKYFTSKSDKVTATSETMMNNLVYIAQRAKAVGTAWEMCQKAYEMNGYKGETPDERYQKMKAFSRKNHWRDAIYNGGNSGVIYDYERKCYKAVFIDYAL